MPTLTLPTQVSWPWLGLEVNGKEFVVSLAEGVSCYRLERGVLSSWLWEWGLRTLLKKVVAKGPHLNHLTASACLVGTLMALQRGPTS